jgi:hypothetical protein
MLNFVEYAFGSNGNSLGTIGPAAWPYADFFVQDKSSPPNNYSLYDFCNWNQKPRPPVRRRGCGSGGDEIAAAGYGICVPAPCYISRSDDPAFFWRRLNCRSFLLGGFKHERNHSDFLPLSR